MCNVFRVDILKSIDDLLEDLLGERFLESSPLPNVVKKVTTCTELHHNDDVFLGLDGLIDLDNMVMPELQKQVDFLHEFLFLDLICKALFIKRFERH